MYDLCVGEGAEIVREIVHEIMCIISHIISLTIRIKKHVLHKFEIVFDDLRSRNSVGNCAHYFPHYFPHCFRILPLTFQEC